MTQPLTRIPDIKMTLSSLNTFETICKRISLNIPNEDKWRWDGRFNTALVTFEKKDMELIYFPIMQEFTKQWDFVSIDHAEGSFFEFFNDQFGLVPGQQIFTSEDDSGIILFATWWPWGDDLRFSLRVGLYANGQKGLNDHEIKAYLTEWLGINN